MPESNPSRVFLDNSTIAGAGRALYDETPDRSDCISLMHLITAALLWDEVHIDGSSRKIPVRVFDLTDGQHKVTQPVNAIWTWEKRFPALASLCRIVDRFWQRELGFDKDKIIDFVFKLLGPAGPESTKGLDLDQIPSVYLSKDYFDRRWLEEKKAEFDKSSPVPLGPDSFKVLLYAWRGVYYHELSKLVDITYLANPQRSRFLEPLLPPGKSVFNYDAPGLETLVTAVSAPQYKLMQALAKEKEKDFALEVFPFAAQVMSQCREDRSEIIKVVSDMRKTAAVRQLRDWMGTYDRAYRGSDLLTLKKLKAEIDKSMRNFERRIGVESVELKVVPSLPWKLLEIKGLDELGASLKVPAALFQELFQKPSLSLMWDIGEKLLRGELGMGRIPALKPIPRTGTHSMEWVLMESADAVQFEGETGGHLLSQGDYYTEGEVAGPGENNLYDYENYWDLQGASARPAFPEPEDGQKKPGQE